MASSRTEELMTRTKVLNFKVNFSDYTILNLSHVPSLIFRKLFKSFENKIIFPPHPQPDTQNFYLFKLILNHCCWQIILPPRLDSQKTWKTFQKQKWKSNNLFSPAWSPGTPPHWHISSKNDPEKNIQVSQECFFLWCMIFLISLYWKCYYRIEWFRYCPFAHCQYQGMKLLNVHKPKNVHGHSESMTSIGAQNNIWYLKSCILFN